MVFMKKRPLLKHPSDADAALVPLANGRGFAVIDASSASFVGRFNWRREDRNGLSYATTSERVNGKFTALSLHALITRELGFEKKRQVDHINRDGLDNRAANLRPATAQENARNRKIRKDSRIGLKGVRFDPACGVNPYGARIKTGGRRIGLGRFKTAKEAHVAYAEAARREFGEFAHMGNI